MHDYHLTLAGLHTLLRTPEEITISENLAPFLCAPREAPDCTIVLKVCVQLPAASENGIWHGPEYYELRDGTSCIFHYDVNKQAAFAVTQIFENGNIEIAVLPPCLSYFSGSTGIFNRIGLETLLLQRQCLLLHASLIKYKGKTIALAGPSGVGKSTQANLWHAVLGAEILNGDRAALRKAAGLWQAYGSPYAGTSGIYKNESGPLAAIVLLSQTEENSLERLSPREAFRQLYPEFTVHHWDKAFVEKATDLCLQLLAEVPVYRLSCRPEESAVTLLQKGLML